MDKTATTLPMAQQSDTRMDEFWNSLDAGLATPAPRNLDVGLSDVARAFGAGGLELVGGIGELAHQAGDYGRQNGGKDQGDYLENARANLAKKLAPALDVVAGVGALAQSGADSLKEGMSIDAREAMTRSLVSESPSGSIVLGDGAGDIDVWAMKMAQGAGSLIPTLASGGITGLAAKATVGRMVTSSMLKRGVSQEVAEAVAAKTVSRLATGAATTAGATGSVGAAGVNARDAVLGMSFDELRNSTTFRDTFLRIDTDQQTAHLSDSEKLQLAREETANVASQATMGDAKTWGAAAVGTLMGDTMLFKMLAGKGAGSGMLKGMAKGAAGEGISEALEEGTQQYSVNEALNEVAGANIDPMKGVVSSAIEGGLIGMGVGSTTGGIGGLRGKRGEVETEDHQTQDAEPTAQDPAPDEQVEPQVTPEPEPPTATDQSPLGPSASQFDELRDVPAYLRQDDTADRFKGMAENSEVQDALAKAPAPTVAELLKQADSQQVEDVMDPESMGDAEAQASRSPTEATIGPLNSLRVTRRGKPFASEKEAQLASRKGIETPVSLNGGGFGVAAIAEVEQVRAMPPIPVDTPAHQSGAELQLDESNTAELGQLSDLTAQGIGDDADTAQVKGDTSQQPLVPAVDTGYRDITPSNEQPEVSHDQSTQIPTISGERQGDQPSAGDPVAGDVEPAIAKLTDRAGVGDQGNLAPPVPASTGQQQDDQTLTTPAPAGVVVSEPAKKVRMSQQREGLSVDEASKVVDDFLRDYNGNILVEPFIREKASEIYGPAIDEQELGNKTKGAYHPGKSIVTVVSRNAKAERAGDGVSFNKEGNGERGLSEDSGRIGSGAGAKADLLATLRHELLGHYGTDTFTPDNKRVLLQKLIDAKNEKWIAPVWKRVAGDSVYGSKSELHQAEEVFAHIAEKELPPRTTQTWDDIKTEFSRLLRKTGLIKGPIKEHELDSLIRAVGKGIRNGERPKQNIRGDNAVIGKQADEPAKPGKPERIIRFSKQALTKGEQLTKHLTRKEAELVTKMWFKQYKGASGIDVRIHATQRELEEALGLDAKEGLIRRAAFDDDTGSLHVAADTIANPKRMREILRHEVLAHYGLANVLGDGEYTKLMSRLIQSQKDPSMRPVWDWVNTHYADEDIGTQAEEVVAHLAELEQGAWGRGWDRVVAWVTRALRAVGFLPDGITAAEIRSLIEGLGKKLQRTSLDDGGSGGKKFSQAAESDNEYKNPPSTTQELQLPKRGSPERVSDSTVLADNNLGNTTPGKGIKLSQDNTAADKAMQKLNLGPKPDIIDKTKTNLNKLRQVDRGVVSSWIDRVIKKANTEVLDALAPIKYAEKAAGITEAADSGYVAARMATGAASTMQATMLYGLPEWKDGVIQRKAGTGEKDALLGIFSDLGKDLHNWLGWMAGHRAEILMGQGRENLLSEQDIAALKGLGQGKEAKFMEAKERWNRLNAATLDLAQEAGLFTADARAEFESEWYVPFFRESEDGDVLAPFKSKGIANQNAGIKKLKGGKANTNDLLENIFTSTSKLIDASMKNMAAQKTVWNLADTGIIEVVAKPNMMDWRALKNGKDLITVKLEGEDYMIRVEDPDLYRAMTFFDRKPFGAMVTVAAKAKRLLTAGVTASPEFMLRNFLRDSLSSWAISKDGFKPVIGSIKGVKKTLAMEGSTIDVMFSGASFLGGYVNGNDPGAMADTVRKSLRRKGMTPEQIAKYEKSIIRNAAHAKGVVADVWEKYSRFGEAFENGNREAVYDAAIKAGKSHAQAAFESKDLMDFSMLGAARAIQGAAMVLPFFNARLQGLGKLTRELRDNPREIAKRAGMITAMSLGLLAINWDDERYEELPDWDKDINWHFFVGDQHWRIPKPFEIGVMFGTIPERMVRALGDQDTGAQFGKAVARAIGDTFAFNPTPQIVKPMVEAAFNYDSFRGGPIDSPLDLAVRAEARYNEQTSLLMRELGELSGFSPKQLEHLVIGYTGTMGSYVMAVADGLIRASRDVESASWRADEIPLVKAVYRGTGPAKSTQHMEEFYRMLNEVNQLKRTVDQYRREGLTDKANELLEEQGGILKSRRSLSRTQQQVRVLRNKIELIQRDKILSAEDKRRRIDELMARRNDLVYQSVKHHRQK